MVSIVLIALISFIHPESVLPVEGKIYVSDIGKFGVGDGMILTIQGDTVATNLIDPKGLAYYDGKLFVTDVNRIWEVTPEGKRIEFVPRTAFQPEAKFLNDIAKYRGKIYVSDTYTNRVFRIDIKDPKPRKIFEIEKPNGICFDGKGTMYIITFTIPAKIFSYRKGKLLKVFEDRRFNGGDGIVFYKNRFYATFYISGQVVELKREGKELKLTKIIKDGLKSPADLGLYRDTLFIPLLNEGKILKINLKEVGR